MRKMYPHKVLDQNGNIQIEMRPFDQSIIQEQKVEQRAKEIQLSKEIERTPEEVERIKNIADKLGLKLKI
jgi:hypothetical protein